MLQNALMSKPTFAPTVLNMSAAGRWAGARNALIMLFIFLILPFSLHLCKQNYTQICIIAF
jgi:hypothetical protein